MPKWLRKSLLVLVTVVTFGMVTPQALLADSPNEDKQAKRDIYQSIPRLFKKKHRSLTLSQILDRDRVVQSNG